MTNNFKKIQPEPLDCQNCAVRGTHHCPACGTTGNALNIEDVALLQGVATSLIQIVDYLESLLNEPDDDRPFEEFDIIDAINTFAAAVAVHDGQLLVWVAHENLDDFLFPLLEETLEIDSLSILLDNETALMNLTEVCEVYGIDMEFVFDAIDV